MEGRFIDLFDLLSVRLCSRLLSPAFKEVNVFLRRAEVSGGLAVELEPSLHMMDDMKGVFLQRGYVRRRPRGMEGWMGWDGSL